MPDFGLEAELWEQGYRHVAGVDEAGRGPLAGPVVAAAVILPHDWPVSVPLDDSKRLAAGQREAAFAAIRERAVAWKIRVVAPAVIDRINILQATLRGMALAVSALRPVADYVLVDGNQAPDVSPPCGTVVKGDGRSNSIAAASILAKVARDRIMAVYGNRYPQWGFGGHKGYPTRAHREALRRHGPSPIHRVSFRAKDALWQDKTTGQEKTTGQLETTGQANTGRNRQRALGADGGRSEVGRRGESIAARYLEQRGYLIRERNFRCAQGEIDLIAVKDGYLVFVEVKTRTERSAYHPAEAVTEAKQRQVRMLGEIYCAEHLGQAEHPEHPDEELQPRFDVVTIRLPAGKSGSGTGSGQDMDRVEHFENAF